jgi:hypothetical protein
VSLDGTERTSHKDEIGKKLTWSRYNPDVRVTEGMMWHPSRKKTSRNPKNRQSGPTWGFFFGQIILGLVEILIPLGFIVGMIYWRAPWLFWGSDTLYQGRANSPLLSARM